MNTLINLIVITAATLFAVVGPFAIPVIAETYMTGLGTLLLVPCLIGCPYIAAHVPSIVLGGR